MQSRRNMEHQIIFNNIHSKDGIIITNFNLYVFFSVHSLCKMLSDTVIDPNGLYFSASPSRAGPPHYPQPECEEYRNESLRNRRNGTWHELIGRPCLVRSEGMCLGYQPLAAPFVGNGSPTDQLIHRSIPHSHTIQNRSFFASHAVPNTFSRHRFLAIDFFFSRCRPTLPAPRNARRFVGKIYLFLSLCRLFSYFVSRNFFFIAIVEPMNECTRYS